MRLQSTQSVCTLKFIGILLVEENQGLSKECAFLFLFLLLFFCVGCAMLGFLKLSN